MEAKIIYALDEHESKKEDRNIDLIIDVYGNKYNQVKLKPYTPIIFDITKNSQSDILNKNVKIEVTYDEIYDNPMYNSDDGNFFFMKYEITKEQASEYIRKFDLQYMILDKEEKTYEDLYKEIGG